MSRDIAKLLLLCLVITCIFSGLVYSSVATQRKDVYGRPSPVDAYSDCSRSSSMNWTGRIAVVKPIFTDTAYSSAFYVFYQRYASSTEPYVTKDLNLLNVTVKHNWGWSSRLGTFLLSSKAAEQNLSLGNQVTLIDEINVTLGGLFRDGKRAYDVLILGFTEYVTAEEYTAYKEFVATGGTLIIMDACNFLAEVKYYPPASPGTPGYLSLVKGHGWEFNGTHAWKSVYARWPDENRNWVGSNYWHWWTGSHYDVLIANTSHQISVYLRNHYGERIGSSYGAHEENLLENLTYTQVIGFWNLMNPNEYPGQPIAAYQHQYMNGSVYHTGIMASDKVDVEEPLQAFLVSAVRCALLGEVGEWEWKKPPPPPLNTDFFSIVALYTTEGELLAENQPLFGTIRCHIYVNGTGIFRNGELYTLISVCLFVYPKTGDPGNPFASVAIAEVWGQRLAGLEWEIVINTTVIPDGDYEFAIRALCIPTQPIGDSIWTSLAVLNRTIGNGFAALRFGVVVASAAFAAVLMFAYAIFLLDKKSRKR